MLFTFFITIALGTSLCFDGGGGILYYEMFVIIIFMACLLLSLSICLVLCNFLFLCTFTALLVVVCEPHRHVLFLVVVCVPHRIGWPVCLIGRRIESVCIHAFHIAL